MAKTASVAKHATYVWPSRKQPSKTERHQHQSPQQFNDI